MLLNIICNLAVSVCIQGTHPCIYVLTKTPVKGTIIFHNEDHYLVNFSQEANKHPWRGDYSEVFIDKEQCMELK